MSTERDTIQAQVREAFESLALLEAGKQEMSRLVEEQDVRVRHADEHCAMLEEQNTASQDLILVQATVLV